MKGTGDSEGILLGLRAPGGDRLGQGFAIGECGPRFRTSFTAIRSEQLDRPRQSTFEAQREYPEFARDHHLGELVHRRVLPLRDHPEQITGALILETQRKGGSVSALRSHARMIAPMTSIVKN